MGGRSRAVVLRSKAGFRRSAGFLQTKQQKLSEFIVREPDLSSRSSVIGIAGMSVFGPFLLNDGSKVIWAIAFAIVLLLAWQVDTTLIKQVSLVDDRVKDAVRAEVKEELKSRLKELAETTFATAKPDWTKKGTRSAISDSPEFYYGCGLYVEASGSRRMLVEYVSNGSVPSFESVQSPIPYALDASFGDTKTTGCVATKSLTVGRDVQFVFACYVPGEDDLHFGKVDSTASSLSEEMSRDARMAMLILKLN